MSIPETPDTVFTPSSRQDYDRLLEIFAAAGLDLQPLRAIYYQKKQGVLYEKAFEQLTSDPALWENLSAHEKEVANKMQTYVRTQRLSYHLKEPLVTEYGPALLGQA